MTDFRKLCAELADALDAETGYTRNDGTRITSSLVSEARAALAEEYEAEANNPPEGHPDPEPFQAILRAKAAALRTALAEGAGVARPIPVAERLPTEADLSDEGTVCFSCWWLCKRFGEHEWHRLPLMTTGACRYHGYTHWLPAAAIPLPEMGP